MKIFCSAIFAALVVCHFPTAVFSQAQPDLRIDNFSVFSTLPGPNGQRRLSVSFRVVNGGGGRAAASKTLVAFDNDSINIATPILAPGATAYLTRTMQTTSMRVAITVQVDALKALSEIQEQNNKKQYTVLLGGEPGRWLSIGPSKIQWSGGPEGVGRVTTIAVDPRSPLTVYAGARGSGVWKSTDSGTTWFPISDSLPSTQIDALSIDRQHPDRVIVATPAGVFESLDGGSVWTQLTSENLEAIGSDGGALLIGSEIIIGNTGGLAGITATTNPALYVSTTGGLRVSLDGGRTWPTILRSGSKISSLQFSTTNPSHLFASAVKPPAVYEAKDRGVIASSWHQLQGCPSGPLPSIPPSSNVWIAESGGAKWMSYRSGAADGNVFELWRTTSTTCNLNGWTEQAWEKVPLSGGVCDKYANHWSYLFAHPNDPSIVFKGGISLCRSISRGLALSRVPGLHGDQHAIAVAPSAPAVMFFGDDGGIYRSDDKGATMHFIGEGLSNTEFLKLDVNGKSPALVVGGSQDNGTSTWDGLSAVWSYVPGTGDSALVAFDRANPGAVYEIGQSMRQITRRTLGNGEQPLGDPALPDCGAYSEFPGAVFESLLSTGSNPPVALTCQGIWSGPPWHQIQPTTGSGDFTRLKLSQGIVWAAATNTGRVYYGVSQQPPLAEVFHTLVAASPSAISFANQSMFYVAMNASSQGSIYRLQCFAGCTNESIWPGTPAGEITAISVDPLAPDTLLAAVRSRGVFRGIRDSLGRWTWSEYNNGLPYGVTVTDLEAQSNGSVVAATYGRGAFLLYSIIPGHLTAKGHVTQYDPEPGPQHTLLISVEIDSKPGLLFTGGKSFRTVLQNAFRNDRLVIIEYVMEGNDLARIVSVKYAGP